MPGRSISLFPHTPDHLRALLEGRDVYEHRFGIKVADGVRDFLIGPEVSPEFLARLKSAAEPDPWKDGFGVLDVAANTIIGFCSFTRSEERRVGKECRSRWSPDHEKKKENDESRQ